MCTAVRMHFVVFWSVTPGSLVGLTKY